MKKHLLFFGAVLLAIMLQARDLPSISDVASNGGDPVFVTEKQGHGQDNAKQTYDIQLGKILREDGTLDLPKGLSGSVNLTGFQMRTRPDGAPYFMEESAPPPDPNDNWQAFGTNAVNGMGGTVYALAVLGNDLYAGGFFNNAGGMPMNFIAKWDGTSWSALGSGMNNVVYALAVSGTTLYAGGNFTTAGGVAANRIAKWNGTSWSALGSGVSNTVNALAVLGTDLYVGGAFTTAGGVTRKGIAKWNGTSWSGLSNGVNGSVNALAVSGTDLYAAGAFNKAGGVAMSNIAKWNGTSWSALSSGMNGQVLALAVSGTDLYAGGWFTTAGGMPAYYLAKWNGTGWSGVGSGMSTYVNALAVSGTDLYSGGPFTAAGGVVANKIAKWDGTSWSALGSGMNTNVNALAVSGTDLYAGGAFNTAGGKVSYFIAKWGEAACPTLSAAPPNVTIVNSTCDGGCTASGGSIVAPTGAPCPDGSSLQYSTDNGATWSGTLPVYDQDGPAQSIQIRCGCDTDGSMVSSASTAVTTAPATCNQVTCYADTDMDGYGDPGNAALFCDACGSGYVTDNTDCNDNPATGGTLEKPGQVWYKDVDGDGYAETGAAAITQCARPVAYKVASELTATFGDCNDGNAAINPAATEVCDGIDNNCNSMTDEGTLATYYRDMDGDGFGNPAVTQMACSQPSGYVANNTDCDDNDPLEKPGQVWYADTDNDGYSDGATQTQCLRPTGYKVASELTATFGDCNDGNAAINPAATEVCDGIDNNCNSMTDEGLVTTYYRDMDGDGFGNPAVTQQACSQPSGYVSDNTDCDDSDNAIYPGAADICDSKDNNCDGNTDEGGLGTPPSWGAGNIGGASNATSEFDCNSGSGSMVFNITSQGFSGAGNADLINSNFQQQCSNASITAHIVGNPAPGWAGIYIREDLSAGSKMVAVKTNLSNFLRREIRTTTNGNKATSQSPLYAGNTWMRIVRTGNTFTFYTSPNGTAWAFFGSTTIAMNSCVYLGLFAESINGATMVNASFDNVAITGGAASLVAAPNPGFKVQEELQALGFDLYPNPTSGEAFIDLVNFQGKALQMEVYSLQGQLLQTTDFQEAPLKACLDLSAYHSGLYLVKVKCDGFPEVTKRIVLSSMK